MLTAKTRVTVIIPAYQNVSVLLETLRGVYVQNGDFDIQTIVVDDHSPNSLLPIIKQHFPQVKVIRNKVNLKSGPSRNLALKNLKTDYIAFLDADDVWKPSFLSKSINTMGSGDVGSICLSDPLYSDDLPQSFKLRIIALSSIKDIFQFVFYYFNDRKLAKSAFYLCQLSHMVFDYKKILDLRFDKKYNFGGEDWKFALECLDYGSLRMVPQRLVHYRYHLKSATQKKINIDNKWNSYSQLLGELDKRRISGPMTYLFKQYINLFK